ncbi:hypothetical protein NDU88_007903, partial [Pleurodeles waltl]
QSIPSNVYSNALVSKCMYNMDFRKRFFQTRNLTPQQFMFNGVAFRISEPIHFPIVQIFIEGLHTVVGVTDQQGQYR